MEKEKIEILYRPGSIRLKQIEKGGCIDMYTYQDVKMRQQEFALIDLGVAMQLPRGYDALIFPRSSTFKNWGLLLTNSVGYIDNSYCGPGDIWKASFYATRDVEIPAGTRLCQFRLIPCQPQIDFIEVNNLTQNENRGGFGSTN